MLIKCIELITHKNTQNIVFNRKWFYSFKKIVLRIFYIEYFSTFGGDFAPIVVRNCGVACNCPDHLRCLTRNPSISLVLADNLNVRQSLQREMLASLA